MAQTYIVDGSVALKWFVEEPKGTEDARRLLGLAVQRDAYLIAPAILAYELPQALLKAVRGRRLPVGTLEDSLKRFLDLDITFVLHQAEAAPWIIGLCTAFGLSFYDASYLALAQARDGVLATADLHLSAAAENAGVRVLRIGI